MSISAALYHVYGHLRSFTSLRDIIPGMREAEVWLVGEPQTTWPAPLVWLRGPWPGGSRCIACRQKTPRCSLRLSRVASWLHVNMFAAWHKRPYWLVALFRRV